ncbi:MAG TPA: nucleoside transporter C-terminal domain-containing protein [Terriglobales bacterium]|nr:nucleoside transporter C-terminal domain-containing protein [Terriglobales bacterium]
MHFTGLLGIIVILGAAYAFSTNRRAVKPSIIAWGIGLQVLFAFLVLKFPYGQIAMEKAGAAVNKLLSFANDGSSFVFGSLADPAGPAGFVFAFRVLPTIIFMAAFFAVLYYFGIMQIIIKGAAWIMTRLMGVSGAESLDVAASIFMGQTEAPLTIRPFIAKLTQSELMTVMTAGMAHVSGGIMAAYIANGVEAKHILGAVIMTAPGTLLIAKTLVPETEVPVSGKKIEIAEVDEHKDQNILSAIARGTGDGLSLAINVAAMLIAFLALIALVNGLMGGIHNWPGFFWFPSSLQQFFGWLFAPIAWLIGIPWAHATSIGGLLGTRMVANELIAFQDLGKMKELLDPRTFTIATYALCGFANLSSIGIQIGGIGALAPERRNDLARLGFRAMLAGTAANLISACIVGMMV